MTGDTAISSEEVVKLHERLDREAEADGYHLNRDKEFTRELVRGLSVNQKRYGYQACPCRLASGNRQDDIDIICPCDYRDADISEYGTCYCGLYVSPEVVKGEKQIKSIPERRPKPDDRKKAAPKPVAAGVLSLSLPVWRCKVCGYLCARSDPPETCPICKASKDRFEKFI
ncbi:MAG: ferredoxin:glutaredoxin reductase [Chloroflexi bacterium]|nr:ferredoxin:glutaredoxin reductase [Chloroflexota bacterium]